MPDYRVEVCCESQYPEALNLLLANLQEADRPEAVRQLLRGPTSIRLDGLFVCRCDGQLAGAMLCLESPGRTMSIWPPRVVGRFSASAGREVMLQLMLSARSFARRRRVRLVYALLLDDDAALSPMLLAHGFFRLTRLCCLQRSATEPVAPPRADIRYRPYNESLHSAFLSVIMGSYDGSMDCPELSGARTPEEILAGHRAQGQFDPSRWLLAERDGRWVGCLLLATWASLGALEIAYVAVLPHARRQGLGRELTRQAVREAATAGLRVVTLTVDERNRAASRMYEQEGFSPWDELDCYILILDPADGRTDRRPQAAESATTA